MQFLQVLLCYVLNYYRFLWFLAFVVCFLTFILYLRKRKVLYKRVSMAFLVFVILCSFLCVVEHLDVKFLYDCDYAVVEGVFVETEDGHMYLYNKDDILVCGDYSGSINYSDRIVDFREVKNLHMKEYELYEDYGFKSGDVVSVLVKREIRSLLTGLNFNNIRTVFGLGGSGFWMDYNFGNPVLLLKVDSLSEDELVDYLSGLEGQVVFSGYTSRGDNYDFLFKMPSNIVWPD